MKKETSIVFTGDIGFDHYMKDRWKDAGLVDEKVLEFLHSNDHVIANVEGPVSECNKQIDDNKETRLLHTIDPGAVRFLTNIHADIWNICNNHIMDAGSKGLEDTIHIARDNDVATIGAGMNIDKASEPVILDEAGGIGIFSVGYQRACRKADEITPGCFSWSDLERIKLCIENIKKKCKWCVIVAHAGEEFTALPTVYTRDRYLEYLDMGADIIVAHHPHVPMNYETFSSGKAIFYSLGNFVFDTDYQRSQFNTEFGVLLSLKFTETKWSFEACGLFINRKTEVVEKAKLPVIFQDIQKEEYEKLAPLAAKMFIAATKRQLIYMKPDKFKDASEEEWLANFYEPLRSGRVPGETLDFQIIYPISLKASEGTWKESQHKDIVEYIQKQM